jgi:hypothetical protein
LGRRGHIGGVMQAAAVSGAEAVLEIRIERARLTAWRTAFEKAWTDGTSQREPVVNPTHMMAFMPAAPRYWVFNTCNRAVADWLVDLGCEVEGWAVVADFRLAAP